MTSFKGYLPTTTFVMGKKAKPQSARAAEMETLVDESFALISASASFETPATTHSVVSMSSDSKTATPKKAEAVSAFTTARIIFVEATPTLTSATGELLGKMIDAMGVKREHAFITDLTATDVSSLTGKLVVALGEEAAQKILVQTGNLSSLRAKVNFLKNGPKVIATYHPTYLIENASAKKDAWEDLKLAMRELSI
jgi:hypothetical protein